MEKGNEVQGKKKEAPPPPLPLPSSAADLIARLAPLCYDDRVKLCARLGRDHKGSPQLKRLLDELRTVRNTI